MISATLNSLDAFAAKDTHGGIVVRLELCVIGSHGAGLSASSCVGEHRMDATILRDSCSIGARERYLRVSFVLKSDVASSAHECIQVTISEQRIFGTDACGVEFFVSDVLRALELQNELMLHAQAAPHHNWMLAHRSDSTELARQREELSVWAREDLPLISIVTPVFNPPVHVLAAMIDSVIAQTYGNWELILANASDENADVVELINNYSDNRIHAFSIPNRSIAENTNEAIGHALGDYIAFVDHDDFIEPDALYQYVQAILEHPDCDLLFCDEDLCWEDDQGELNFYGPRFKPGWNYDLALTHNYICHMLMVSRFALDRTERSGVDVSAAQDYDLTFKVAEIARCICHVPKVLYHWRESITSTARNRDSKPYALNAGKLAVQHHLDRMGVAATVHIGAFPFSYRVQYHLPDPAVGVTLVIGYDGKGDIVRALHSIRKVTEYPWDRYEIIVITPKPNRRHVQRAIREALRIKQGTCFVSCCLVDDGDSLLDALEAGIASARFDTIVSLNAFCEAVEGNWLTELIEPLRRKDVAISAPLLLDGDGLVSSFGMTLGANGELIPIGTGMQLTDPGYMSIMFHARDCDVVPGVGAAFRRRDWADWMYGFGGESFASCCLRAREKGLKVVVEPYGPLGLWMDVKEDANPSLLSISPKCSHGDSYLNPWLNSSSSYFALQ